MADFKSNGQSSGEEPLRVLVRDLAYKMDNHINRMDDHIKKTDRLNNIMFGDKDAQIEGLAYKVNKHEKYISRDKNIKYLGAGTMMAGGAAMGFWDKIMHFFFK